MWFSVVACLFLGWVASWIFGFGWFGASCFSVGMQLVFLVCLRLVLLGLLFGVGVFRCVCWLCSLSAVVVLIGGLIWAA